MPALAKHNYGNGTTYYITSRNEESFQKDFYNDLVSELGIEKGLGISLPYGVTVAKRINAQGVEIHFVQNFNPTEIKLQLKDSYVNLETEEKVHGEITMKPYSCFILKIM